MRIFNKMIMCGLGKKNVLMANTSGCRTVMRSAVAPPEFVVWTQPSSIIIACLHKPLALAVCSSTHRNAICPSSQTHIPFKQTLCACLTNWAHLFTRKIFIEQLGLLRVSSCFSLRGFLPFLLRGRLFTAGSAWHPLTWHWETVTWPPLVSQRRSQSQRLLQCNSCAFGRHSYRNEEHFCWLFHLLLITTWLACQSELNCSLWEIWPVKL